MTALRGSYDKMPLWEYSAMFLRLQSLKDNMLQIRNFYCNCVHSVPLNQAMRIRRNKHSHTNSVYFRDHRVSRRDQV